MIAVGSWPVPWVPYGHLGGVVGFLSPVWLRGAWPLLWALHGCRGGV